MPPRWLSTARSILRGLKCRNTASPATPQLEQLHITIREAEDLSGLANICVVSEFLRGQQRRLETHCMLGLFRLSMSADFCTKYVSSLLSGWIAEGLAQQAFESVQIKNKPLMHIQNDTYSGGVRAEMTALCQEKRDKKYLHLSVVTRAEHRSDTLISSSELYALLSTARKQSSRHPLVGSLEVRILVVYSRWVQIVTAKTTPSYVTSIVEGWENIADQMEISQTQWFNFTDISGQIRVLLAALEATTPQSLPIKKPRLPLGDLEPTAQNFKSPKRKLDTSTEHGNKRRKGNNTGDETRMLGEGSGLLERNQ